MKVGVLKELKTKENRVAMTPAGVEQMVVHGHNIRVESLKLSFYFNCKLHPVVQDGDHSDVFPFNIRHYFPYRRSVR